MSESLTRAVFTTKFVIEDNSPIVYVSHDEEGDWQFFGAEENVGIENARIVTLGEILEMDSSIKDILNLPIGSEAYRDKLDGSWYIPNE